MKPLLLSVFSRNMLSSPELVSETVSLSKEEASILLKRGAEAYMPKEDLANTVMEDLQVRISYQGTRYLQLEAGQVAVTVHQKQDDTLQYSKVTIKSNKPSLITWLASLAA